jgi:cytochrome c biogenesis protein CcmG/thiol:disulfide interchange protein DsbE
MAGKSYGAIMAVIGVVALLVFGVIAKGENQLEAGEAAPVVELEVLADGPVVGEPNRTGSIADYRGKWVLLNIWASWCLPCEDEAPELVAFQKRHRSPDFTILGIQTQDGTEDGLAFVDEFGLNYPSLRDGSGDYADELGSTGVPESILLDAEGNVAYIRRGQIDAELLDAEVLPLIQGATVEPEGAS